MRAGDPAQDVAVLEQAAAAQELLAQQAVEASHTLAAGLSLELQRTHAFKQVIAAHMNGEPHPCCSSNGGLWLQLAEDVLGDIFPDGPRSLPAECEQAESHIHQLGAALHPLPSLIPPLLSQLQDQAGSAHDIATTAVSQGKAVLSDAKSLLASLEGQSISSHNLALTR